MSVLEFRNIGFSYNRERTVLKDINLRVEQGDYLIVLGPNGGGKSTFLKLLVGLLKPTKGQVFLFDQDKKSQLKRVGYLPQHTNVNPHFPISVQDVVVMGRLRNGGQYWFTRKQDRAHACEMLDSVGLVDFRDRRIGDLSGGQRQRVLIARALMTDPELLVLDEPTASIDAAAKSAFYELLEKLNQSVTIIMVSHDLSIIPSGVKSVACVNQTLHYHNAPQITEEMLIMTYGCTSTGNCPVELVAHGVPHRVLSPHHKDH
ncbi:MAG: ABC transporter [SAR324 cluster bacterium]|uniref:ABC transporter n=1 Tax=SAR324 cluster bacterium TaxID=2024889 RepID=A0A2A4SSK3_9DELT|nr:MAG: ABC transporter [SAR324 cluster bacterium]